MPSPDLVPITTFSFSPSSNSWIPYQNNNDVRNNNINNEGKFRLATFNVLHDNNTTLREYTLQSPKRNNNMVKLISELDAGIIIYYLLF